MSWAFIMVNQTVIATKMYSIMCQSIAAWLGHTIQADMSCIHSSPDLPFFADLKWHKTMPVHSVRKAALTHLVWYLGLVSAQVPPHVTTFCLSAWCYMTSLHMTNPLLCKQEVINYCSQELSRVQSIVSLHTRPVCKDKGWEILAHENIYIPRQKRAMWNLGAFPGRKIMAPRLPPSVKWSKDDEKVCLWNGLFSPPDEIVSTGKAWTYFADMNLWKSLLSHQIAVFSTWPTHVHD